MLSPNKKMVIISLIAVFFIMLDRWFKAVAINFLQTDSLVITDWLQLSLGYNPNVAFSLPLSGPLLNIAITILIIILTFSYLSYKKNQLWLEAGWLFTIILGALSNLYDRIQYQAVIDYIDLKYFTIFNLADVLIVIGSFSLIYISWKKPKPKTLSND